MEAARHPSVAVVIPCYRQARFLAGAIESALDQHAHPSEIIVVDDGGEEDLAAIVGEFPSVHLLRRDNGGLAAARNSGLRASRADRIIFLDADDRLLRGGIAAGLDCFAANPGVAFVYGAHEDAGPRGVRYRFKPALQRADLVRFNCVGMIASAMFDRAFLLDYGGFDESLGMCEDWDLFLRLSRRLPFATHDRPVARYFKHSGNMSNDAAAMRYWIAVVRERESARGLSKQERQSWREGAALWDASYPDRSLGGLGRRVFRKAIRSVRRTAPARST